MKTLTVNRNSWHYKLAKLGGRDVYYETDICSYTRRVMFGVVLAILATAAGIGAIYLLVDIVLGLGFSIWYGVWLMNAPGEIALMVVAILSFSAGVIFSIEKVSQAWRRHKRNQYDREPGFVGQAYQSWKHKYCTKIEFRDEDEHNDNLRAGN